MGQVRVIGGGDYAMRIWLNPNAMASRSLTVDEVLAAVRAQNVEVSSGVIGGQAAAPGMDFQFKRQRPPQLRGGLRLPLAVILIVPMSLLTSLVGVWRKGSDTQIGFIVLIGLACKNAILIVEFARGRYLEGQSIIQAAVEACGLRVRLILMTSCACIMGLLPLVFATGAGAEMQQAMGVVVFSGMLGVTIFGLFLTPLFSVIIESIRERTSKRSGHQFPEKVPPREGGTHRS